MTRHGASTRPTRRPRQRGTRATITSAAMWAGVCAAVGLGAPQLAHAGQVEVPLEVGAGPVTHTWFGAVGADQPLHPGLVITADVVLDRAWLREHGDQVPQRWRDRIGYVDEVRIRPLWFLPESLILSPKLNRTGMIGASWRPISIGVPFITTPVRIGADVGARLTAAYVWTDVLPDSNDPKNTFFLRPGVDLAVDAIFPVTDTFRVRLGADAQAYVPQAIGGFGVGKPGERMMFLARGFVELRFRVPVQVKR